MANKFRASFEGKIGEKTYELRPTFEAISEFIDRSGMDPFEALGQYEKKGGLGVKVIVAAVYAGIYGELLTQGRKAPSFSEIGNECQTHGFNLCAPIALEFLYRGVGSDEFIKKLEETREELKKESRSNGGDTLQD